MSLRPRLLLLEDDATIQQLVRLALEEFDLDLIVCASLAAARAQLAAGKVQMLITDLMLPDGSGLDLLQDLQSQPALIGSAPIVVFSAGVVGDLEPRLAQLGVWRLLAKPCSVLDLEACVAEGLGLAPGQGSHSADAAASAQPGGPAVALPAEQAQAVGQHFGGDERLYRAFRAACVPQFDLDRQQGDLACERADAPALRRLAHSLKSVLLTLGHAEASQLARRLEDCAERQDWTQCLPLWQALRTQLPEMP